MIRASLSDRRSNVSRSCCRWLAKNGGGGEQQRLAKRRMPIASATTVKSSHYHSIPRRSSDASSSFNGRPSSTSWRPTEAFSARRRRPASSSMMSTKPSYDLSGDDDDADVTREGHDHIGNDDDDGSDIRWIKRSTGFDNLSRYDNYYQYESPAEKSSSAEESIEESLLHLLSENNNKNKNTNGTSRPRPTRQKRDDSGSRFEEDASLLQLLNKGDNAKDYHMKTRVPHKEQKDDTFDSLLQLLTKNVNGDPPMNGTHVPQTKQGGDASLLQLLSQDNVEDHSRFSSNSQGNAHLQHQQTESNDSLLDLLKGHLNEPQSSSGEGDSRLQRQQTETSDPLMDLLKGHLNNESQLSSGEGDSHLHHHKTETNDPLMDLLKGHLDGSQTSATGLNGRAQPLQYQPPESIVEEPAESLYELLNEKTKDNKDSKKYQELNKLQLQLEMESTEEAINKCLEVWNSARSRSDYETIPVVRRTIDSWYGPLTDAIELEQWLYLNHDNTSCTLSLSNEGGEKDESVKRSVKDRSVYGPLLCLLPPQKIAVILAHTALSFSIAEKSGEAKVVALAMYIAAALETEVNVSRTLRVRAKKMRMKPKSFDEDGEGDEDNDSSYADTVGVDVIQGEAMTPNDNDKVESIGSNRSADGIDVDSWIYTATHLKRFLDEVDRGKYEANNNSSSSLKGKGRVRPTVVRKRCKEILLAEGFTPEGITSESEDEASGKKQLTINDFAEWDPVKKVKLGAALLRLLIDQTTFSKPKERGDGGHNSDPEPAFQLTKKYMSTGKSHGVVSVHPDLLSIAVEEELNSAKSMSLSPAHFNTRVQPMVVPPKDWTDVNKGGYELIKVPFMRTRHCKTQKDSINRANLSKVMEGLNALGKIPWTINQKVLDAALKCWDDGIVLGDIPSKVDYEVPPMPESMEYQDYKLLGDFEKKAQLDAYRKFKERSSKHNRFKQKNMDLHSLRCSAILKLNQAQKFRDFEEIFFPYNVDFRGRAYPVPPHLSIVGSDLCRALLMFAHPKALGKNGLYWLKVHLANLAGADKMSFDGRANFADENMDSIRTAVNDPFGENDWWTKFDDPFQGLATCHEIINAIDSGDHVNYMCSLPVHMDGSCNGLQHYAALGRDKGGGKAVNLCIDDKPQDVYIGVMHEVIRRVAEDADEMIPFDKNKSDLSRAEKALIKKVDSAQLVNGLIDRGVVKRTVMTSVYGVTFIGAKNQISEKIEEKLEEKGYDIDEIEPQIHTACGYLASLTMEVMGQQFKGARETMNWLTRCARLIAAQGQPVSFISPIGVPVVQPYRQRRSFNVVTLLQSITLTNDSDVLPLHRQRQVSAFPPNYVHSLDSSHMLLTAIEMEKRGLQFSAVHDSYWTHPCDIEEMNVVLRDCFVDLYDRPLLEELKQMWEMRYPTIEFPDIPAQGDLDLNDVRSAPYFFQ